MAYPILPYSNNRMRRIKQAATEQPTIPMSAMDYDAGTDYLRRVASPLASRAKLAAQPADNSVDQRDAFDTAMAAGQPGFNRLRTPQPPDIAPVEVTPQGAQAPQARLRQPSAIELGTPKPAMSIHEGGFGSRMKDAAKLGLLMAGDGGGDFLTQLGRMAGGALVGAVNPQAAHAAQYEMVELPRWERQREREIAEALIADDTDMRRLQVENIITDDQRQVQQMRENNARQAIILAQRMRTAVPVKAVAGTQFESFAGKVPPRDFAEVDRIVDTYGQYGAAVPGEIVRGTPYEALGGRARMTRTGSGNVQVREGANGELMERDPATGEWKPAMTAGGDVFRTPRSNQERKITASDRSAAKLRAQNRVKQEYTGGHINQIINDYANGLYQTYAQEMGIDWQVEQLAKGPPPPDYEREEMAAYLNATKLIQAARSRAQAEAKRIVERDLERLEAQYIDEELEQLETEKPARGSRPVSRMRTDQAPVPDRSPEQERAEAEKNLNTRIKVVEADRSLSSTQKAQKIERLRDLFNRYFGQGGQQPAAPTPGQPKPITRPNQMFGTSPLRMRRPDWDMQPTEPTRIQRDEQPSSNAMRTVNIPDGELPDGGGKYFYIRIPYTRTLLRIPNP